MSYKLINLEKSDCELHFVFKIDFGRLSVGSERRKCFRTSQQGRSNLSILLQRKCRQFVKIKRYAMTLKLVRI